MLTREQAEALSEDLKKLRCIDLTIGDGLFTFVFLGEQGSETDRYSAHLTRCEFCRVARELYRYKRDAATLVSRTRTGE